MKVLVNAGFEKYWEREFAKIKEKFSNILFVFARSKEDVVNHLLDADVYIGGYLTDREVETAENLKIIFVPWAGVDLLPRESLIKKGVMVSNSHGNAKIVAQRAITLALAVMGKVVSYHNDLQKGIWHGFAAGFNESELWTSLWGKKCSILGFGNIGQYLAKILKGFDCNITAFKRKIIKIDDVDDVTNDLYGAVSSSDVVFSLLPLTPFTEDLLNWDLLSKMKGKFLVNVGRGKVINEYALFKALKDNILAGAAIDVWYQYPTKEAKVVLPSKYPIHLLNNVVISPHVGGYSIEGQVNRIKDVCDGLLSFIERGVPKNLVDLTMGY